MKQIYPDLWRTETEHPFPGSPGVTTHAYLLVRAGGNVLFYGFGQAEDRARIRELGGITHQLLSHRDEAGPALAEIRAMFGSKLCCHGLEAEAVRAYCPVDVTFDRRAEFLDGIEVIPVPGHTPGSVCFLVNGAEDRDYLFTGDTMTIRGAGWGMYITSVGDAGQLRDSLALLRGLAPDVVISSVSSGGDTYREMTASSWRAAVDSVLASF